MGMLLYGSLFRVSVLSEYDYPGACGRQEKQEGVNHKRQEAAMRKNRARGGGGGKKFRRKQKTSSQVCAKGGALLVLWGHRCHRMRSLLHFLELHVFALILVEYLAVGSLRVAGIDNGLAAFRCGLLSLVGALRVWGVGGVAEGVHRTAADGAVKIPRYEGHSEDAGQ